MKKFNAVSYSHRTEIQVNICDGALLMKALNDQDFDFTSSTFENEFRVKTKIRLGVTAVNYLKGRIIPKGYKKPVRPPKKPVYDKNIIVGIKGNPAMNDFRFIYKQIN